MGLDEILKQLLGQGVLGLVIIGLVVACRGLLSRLDARDAKLEELREKHKAEIEAFHARIDGKAENFHEHLMALSATSQENDVKTNAVLERLLTMLESIREAVRASASRKRNDV